MNDGKHHFDDCRPNLEKCRCDLKRYWQISKISFFLILPVQIAGSLLSGSLALLADSVHVAIDGLASLLNIGIEYWVVSKKPTKKFENLARSIGGCVSAGLLLLIAFLIGQEAVIRLIYPAAIVSWLMLSAAILGGLGNVWQCWILHQSESRHLTQKAAQKHVWSDLWQSIAVVIGGIAIVVGYPIGDAIVSLLVSVNIARFGLELIWQSWKYIKL